MAQPLTETARRPSVLAIMLWMLATLIIAIVVSVFLWDGRLGSVMSAHRVLPALPLFEVALYLVILVVLPGEGTVPAGRALVGILLAIALRVVAAATTAILRHPDPDGSFGAAFLNFYATYWVGALVQIAVVAFFLSLVRDLLERRPQSVTRRSQAAPHAETAPERTARQEALLSALMDGNEAVQRRADRDRRLAAATGGEAEAPPAPAAPPDAEEQTPDAPPLADSDEAASAADTTDSFPPVTVGKAGDETPSAPAVQPQLELVSEPDVAEPVVRPGELLALDGEADQAARETLAELGAQVAAGVSTSGRCIGLALPEGGNLAGAVIALEALAATDGALCETLRIGAPEMTLLWLGDHVAGIAQGGEHCGIAVAATAEGSAPGPLSLALRRGFAALEVTDCKAARPTTERPEPVPLVPAAGLGEACDRLAEFARSAGSEAAGYEGDDVRWALLLCPPGADGARVAAEVLACDADAAAFGRSLGLGEYQRLIIGAESGGIALAHATIEGRQTTVALIARGRSEPGALGLQLTRALRALSEPGESPEPATEAGP